MSEAKLEAMCALARLRLCTHHLSIHVSIFYCSDSLTVLIFPIAILYAYNSSYLSAAVKIT